MEYLEIIGYDDFGVFCGRIKVLVSSKRAYCSVNRSKRDLAVRALVGYEKN